MSYFDSSLFQFFDNPAIPAAHNIFSMVGNFGSQTSLPYGDFMKSKLSDVIQPNGALSYLAQHQAPQQQTVSNPQADAQVQQRPAFTPYVPSFNPINLSGLSGDIQNFRQQATNNAQPLRQQLINQSLANMGKY